MPRPKRKNIGRRQKKQKTTIISAKYQAYESSLPRGNLFPEDIVINKPLSKSKDDIGTSFSCGKVNTTTLISSEKEKLTMITPWNNTVLCTSFGEKNLMEKALHSFFPNDSVAPSTSTGEKNVTDMALTTILPKDTMVPSNSLGNLINMAPTNVGNMALPTSFGKKNLMKKALPAFLRKDNMASSTSPGEKNMAPTNGLPKNNMTTDSSCNDKATAIAPTTSANYNTVTKFPKKISPAKHGKTQIFCKCEVCGKKLRQASLRKHMLFIHSGDKQFNKTFSRNKKDNSFGTREDNDTDICDSFENVRGTCSQSAHKVKDKKYECEACGKNYFTRAAFKVHVKEEHLFMIDNKYACKLCNKVYSRINRMIGHIYSVHMNSKLYTCFMCRKTFIRSCDLEIHLRIHLEKNHFGETPFKCDLCGLGFSDRPLLRRHIIKYHNKKRFLCEHCGRTFKELTQMHRHIKIHTCDKKYICEICGKAFQEAWMLSSHNITHSEEKPHVCASCGKKFKRKLSLKTHKCEPDKDEPLRKPVKPCLHNCNLCGKGFHQKRSLKQHFVTHSAKRFECEFCDKKFVSLSELNRHRKIHMKDKWYECTSCDKKFCTKGMLRAHLRTYNGEKRYECDICKTRFATEIQLGSHINIHCTLRNTTGFQNDPKTLTGDHISRPESVHQRIQHKSTTFSNETTKGNTTEGPRKLLDEGNQQLLNEFTEIKQSQTKVYGIATKANNLYERSCCETITTNEETNIEIEQSATRKCRCEICDEELRDTEVDLSEHIRLKHAKTQHSKCKLCRRDLNKKSLTRHMNRHHVKTHTHTGEQRCGCETCEAQFNTRAVLQMHMCELENIDVKKKENSEVIGVQSRGVTKPDSLTGDKEDVENAKEETVRHKMGIDQRTDVFNSKFYTHPNELDDTCKEKTGVTSCTNNELGKSIGTHRLDLSHNILESDQTNAITSSKIAYNQFTDEAPVCNFHDDDDDVGDDDDNDTALFNATPSFNISELKNNKEEVVCNVVGDDETHVFDHKSVKFANMETDLKEQKNKVQLDMEADFTNNTIEIDKGAKVNIQENNQSNSNTSLKIVCNRLTDKTSVYKLDDDNAGNDNTDKLFGAADTSQHALNSSELEKSKETVCNITGDNEVHIFDCKSVKVVKRESQPKKLKNGMDIRNNAVEFNESIEANRRELSHNIQEGEWSNVSNSLKIDYDHYGNKASVSKFKSKENLYEKKSFNESTTTNIETDVGKVKKCLCEICDKLCNTKVELEEHIQRDHISTVDGLYECKSCQKNFTTKLELQKHVASKHVKTQIFCKCEVCGKELRQLSLKKHMLIHTGDKLFKCDVCEKRFTQSCTLYEHKRIHTSDKPYQCSSCGKRFYTSGKLRAHERIHIGEKPYRCGTCEARFATQRRLTVHISTHTKHKPFMCDACGNMYKSQRSFRNHLETHPGDKRHICQMCGSKFLFDSSLKKHMTEHNDTGKRYECETCGKRFMHKENLDSHTKRSAHHKSARDELKILAFECAVCSAKFAKWKYLRNHAKRLHNIVLTHEDGKSRPYNCKLCVKTYAHLNSLFRHMKKHE